MDATKVDLIVLSIQKIVIWLTNHILIVSILALLFTSPTSFFPLLMEKKSRICDESKFFGIKRANCSWLKYEVEG